MHTEKLIEFMKPFIRQDEIELIEPKPHVVERYRQIVYDLLLTNLEALRVIAIDIEDGTTEEAYELVLKIELPEDGSYVYIVIYGMNPSFDDEMSMKIHVAEHDSDGMVRRAHVYSDEDGILRRDDCEDRELLSDYHFDYIDFIETMVEVMKRAASEWDSERELAQESLVQSKNVIENTRLEEAMQINNLPISEDELAQLAELLKKSEPVLFTQ